jgi:ABC-2 type transport system ATP-binding protein
MRPILKIRNVSKIYKSAKKTVVALNDINLDIFAGEIFGLLGVNGAGKTTLSSILATLHPPTSGDVLFHDASIYKNLNHYRNNLGFCPQHQNLDMELSVEENLIFAGRYFLLPKEEIAQRSNNLIAQLELEKYRHFAIKELSGGNKQRVLIARALIHNPKIVILDEPTVGLDPDIRRKLWDIIRDLKAQGITVILTTHYLDEAEYLSDRVCMLHKGKIMLVESLHTLKQKHELKNLEEIFLQLTKEYQDES